MKKFNLRSVAVAVAALSAGSAFAALSLDGTPTANVYASEAMAGVSASSTRSLEDGTGTDLDLSAAHGYTLGLNVQTFVRVDLSSNAEFKTTSPSAIAVDSLNTTVAATVSSGGAGESYVVFSFSPSSSTARFTTTSNISVILNSAGLEVTDSNPVTARVRVFETGTAAVNPTTSNALKDSSTKTIVTYANYLATPTVVAGALTADVSATAGVFKNFTSINTNGQSLGQIDGTVTDTSFLLNGGTAAGAGTVVTDSTVLTVTGTDFSWIKSSSEGYTATAVLDRVFLSSAANCATSINSITKTASATALTFANIAASNLTDFYVCAKPETTTAIGAQTYTYTLSYNGQSGYTPTSVSGTTVLGSIARNGTELMAPFATIRTGYTSRLLLTNSSSTESTVTVTGYYRNNAGTLQSCTGTSTSSFTLYAGAVTEIPVTSICSAISNNGRYLSLKVTANLPNASVDGVYQQFKNADSALTGYGSDVTENTQYTLIRPGSAD